MMRVAVYGRSVQPAEADFVAGIFESLAKREIEFLVHKDFLIRCGEMLRLPAGSATFTSHLDLKEGIDCMISIGGDGTLLDTLSFVRHYDIPVMGINTGRLGFLSSVGKEDFELALDALQHRTYAADKRSLLCLHSDKPLFGEVHYALNDFTIHKKDVNAMIVIHTYINGEFLNSYWADGLIIATPTGSTAYSMSCGGPILLPNSGSFVITPVAPHNLSLRPVVVPDTSVISFEVEGRTDQFLCTLDSRTETIDANTKLAIKKSESGITLVRLNDNNFLRTLSNKLMWGADKRN